MKENLTFENLPSAVKSLHLKLENIEKLLIQNSKLEEKDVFFNVQETADFLKRQLDQLQLAGCDQGCSPRLN